MKCRMTNDEWFPGARPCGRICAALPFVIRHSSFVIAFCLTAAAQSSDDALKLNPPYAELPPTFWEQHGSLVVIGSVFVVLVVALVVWLALRPKPVPPVPPETRARLALDALAGRGEDGALLSEVSQILRRYFVAAFGLSAGELTTTEFCRLVGGNEALGVELSSALVKFLEICDVKKFAPAPPAAPLNAVAQALELFERAEARRAQLTTAGKGVSP